MREKNTLTAGIALFFTILFCSVSHAVLLPKYSISSDDWGIPAERVLARYSEAFDQIGKNARLQRLAEHAKNPKIPLGAAERAKAGEYKRLSVEIEFWKYVVNLKESIIRTHFKTLREVISPCEAGVGNPAEMCGPRTVRCGAKLPHTEKLTSKQIGFEMSSSLIASPDAVVADEADEIAKTIIETIYSLSQEYKVGSSALIHNFLINRGLKKNGFCYHYVDALRKALSKRTRLEFDLRWGTAWEGDFRENNALVITKKGAPFETGLAVDAWRSSGRPFWTPVKGDRFPWIEAFDVAIE